MRRQRGITMLEMMIVLAVIGMGAFFARSGFRMLTKADLVESAEELTTVLQRTSQLAITRGEMHRVVFNFEKHQYVVETCQGAATLLRNERLDKDPEEAKRALERGKQRIGQLPDDALASGDAEEATRKAIAVAGHHVADRACVPAEGELFGDATGKGWARQLPTHRDVRLKEIWVQHLERSATKDKVAIYFFPMGSAEKAVIELTDGTDTFSVLVYGLTGRVELRDGPLRDVDSHMLKNPMGDRDSDRDGEGEER